MADALVVKSHAAITARNANSSPLLRLPPELRNKIYTYVLTSRYGIHTWCYAQLHGGISVSMSGSVDDLRTQPDYFAVLRTCRQIHSEARLLPLTLNTLVFENHECLADRPVPTEPTQRAGISRVRLFDAFTAEGSDFCKAMIQEGYTCARDLWPNLNHVELIFEFGPPKFGEDTKAWWRGGAKDVKVVELFV
ncbi:hypothetical protein FB567DRAFT_602292 [Paraphoma chrysanthemicola]|uniref:Uncharacterized protein n=1 Tax=Paraphoma chrysanthemicola TaxID=798071 RepID=A0A8K0R791_9PLEO|nr:hypothetical protein FB567DRAFT_602292 [Paraphoma chrysanthemicola]